MVKEKVIFVIFTLMIFIFAIFIFFMFNKRYMKIIIILGTILVFAMITIGISMAWISPVKYALKEEDFNKYTKYILIREVHYTGTGWSIVGDQSGYFSDAEVSDVILEGEKLPEAYEPAERYNTFLCIVEYKGKENHMAFDEKLDCYIIKDWYPVYPVVRNRLLPQSFYPRKYMTEKDIKGY